MIALLFSIISSGLIFVIFKLFPRYGIDTFQAIVFNYFTAFACGTILFGNEWKDTALQQGQWPLFVVISAFLFISLFILMGISSQRNGVALTSIAVKMSMAISMLLMITLYRESLSALKMSGILFAFTGVFLVSFSGKEKSTEKGSMWMLGALFFGSGILDFVLNYVQKYELFDLSPSLFSAFGFGLAGIIGLIILAYRIISGHSRFHPRNIAAGIVLGIPNYFSIFLLITAYKETGWKDTTVLSITNVSVVLMSALIGFTAFKEQTSTRKFIGLAAAIAAIVFLYLADIN
ncbi:MAG: EamA family transporter [Flavobacteriia bacterium]|jgi:drug/metabolite transporter (DMT)-like permease